MMMMMKMIGKLALVCFVDEILLLTMQLPRCNSFKVLPTVSLKPPFWLFPPVHFPPVSANACLYRTPVQSTNGTPIWAFEEPPCNRVISVGQVSRRVSCSSSLATAGKVHGGVVCKTQ